MSARSYRLKENESPSAGIRRIALGRAEKAIEELDAAAAGNDFADSIHAARKDLKKLRAVANLVRPELGGDLHRAEDRRYRAAGRLLAQSRDAEVKVETLGALRESSGEGFSADLAAAWLAALEGERDAIAEGDSDEDGPRLAGAKALIETGQEKIAAWPLEDDSWQLVEAGLRRSYRRGRREMKRTQAEPVAENVHEWRKRTKDLWYQLRILREAWPSVLGPTAEQAHELADLLGDHHDLALLAADLAASAADEAIERRQQELLDSARDVGARLYAEKPKAFGRRIESYWLAWRTNY